MRVSIEKGAPVGMIAAPPSKSYGHRMMICAAMAVGGISEESRDPDACVIRGIGGSAQAGDDILATADCIRALGIDCDISKDEEVIIRRAPEKDIPLNIPVFPCRESGSTLRFFIPIAMALRGGGIFTGSKRLIQRGIGVYEEAFAAHDGEQGIRITKGQTRITVEGRLRPGEITVRGDVSSQFVSGLLYALPVLEKDSTLHVTGRIESRRYIDITTAVMKDFGVAVYETEPGTFYIPGGQRYKACDRTIEGDWSNSAFLYGMKYLHEGSIGTGMLQTGERLRIQGLDPDSLQADKVCIEYFRRLDRALDETDDAIDLSDCPDLGPVLFAYAAARGGGRFTGVGRLRIKESDRVASMQEELERFGIRSRSTGDDLIIYPGELRRPEQVLHGHNDHRVVMALTVLCTLTGGVIEGAQAVAKSWPAFFSDMEKLGINIRTEK